MKIEIFPSGSGDCLLITSSDDKRMLVDGGLPDAYSEFIAAPLAALRDQNKVIDVAYVSHIDRDHIGGILRMLDDEMSWRVAEHLKKKGRPFKEPAAPRPPQILQIWHNAFLESVAKTQQIQLSSALSASANALTGAKAAGLGTPHAVAEAERVEMLALSVGDAIEVNWRIGDDQLGIPLDPDFGGKFMTARKQPIQLGSMTVQVLGPTVTELKELRTEWIEWLNTTKESYLERLRGQHQKDIDQLRSSVSPLELARRARALAADIEKDVTPPNLASLVLLVEENGKRVLLTGDAGDESLMRYLKSAGLLDANGTLEVDVLKVPHHGADNSYSKAIVECVRAQHYIFCGDGDHHNPEPNVVKGYLEAIKKTPLAAGGDRMVHFNWSLERAVDHVQLWKDVEAHFTAGTTAKRL